jgi:PAS domain S-box-containing protein
MSWHQDEQRNAVVASGIVQSTMLGELVEHARIGAVAVDDRRYVAANAYACELLGYDREELIGRRVGDLRPNPELQRQLDEIVEGNRSSGDVTVVRKDGGELALSYRVAGTSLAGLDSVIFFFWVAGDSE